MNYSVSILLRARRDVQQIFERRGLIHVAGK